MSFTKASGRLSCTGPVELASGAEAERLNQSIRDHLLTDAGHATIGKLLGAHEDTTIIINPERWMSWSGSGLMGRIVELDGDMEAHPPETWSATSTCSCAAGGLPFGRPARHTARRPV